jgi:hypothetical protein
MYIISAPIFNKMIGLVNNCEIGIIVDILINNKNNNKNNNNNNNDNNSNNNNYYNNLKLMKYLHIWT